MRCRRYRDYVPDGWLFLRVHTRSYALSSLTRLVGLRGLRAADAFASSGFDLRLAGSLCSSGSLCVQWVHSLHAAGSLCVQRVHLRCRRYRDYVSDGWLFLRVHTRSYALSSLTRLVCLQGLRAADAFACNGFDLRLAGSRCAQWVTLRLVGSLALSSLTRLVGLQGLRPTDASACNGFDMRLAGSRCVQWVTLRPVAHSACGGLTLRPVGSLALSSLSRLRSGSLALSAGSHPQLHAVVANATGLLAGLGFAVEFFRS